MEEKNKENQEKEELNDNENAETGEEEAVDNSQDELNKLQAKIGELEKQVTEYKDAYLRKAAEFDNFKRRNENDMSNMLKYSAEPFIRSILPVYDDLERSLNHISDESSFESLKKGLDLVYDKFTKILDGQGVKKIDAKGKPFDVDLPEALMQQPDDKVPPHTVLDVIEQGYIYKDKVLRHAKVIVSSESISSESDDAGNSAEGNE